jgi:hypothetical protein
MKLLKYILFFAIFVNILYGEEDKNGLYIFYEDCPKKVYQNQVFAIQLKLISSDIDFDSIEVVFENSPYIKIHNIDSQWTWDKDTTFLNTYYISLSSIYSHLPQISISTVKYKDINNNPEVTDGVSSYISSIFKDNDINKTSDINNTDDTNKTSDINITDEVIEEAPQEKQIKATVILKSKRLSILPIKWSKNYSNLLVKDFSIVNYDVKKYNSEENIISIDIDTKYSNLYDFNIHSDDIITQGLDLSSRSLPYSSGVYYAIVNKKLKSFKFNFFNLTTHSFEYKSLPIWVEHETISTQTDINPSTGNFKLLKTIFICIIILIFIAFFIFRKKKVYLFIAFIMTLVLIRYLLPLDTIMLQQGTKIKILPIQKSTIFEILDRETKVNVLKYKNNFVKVIFNNKVGWVHKDVIDNK